jgi:hypothetical protein
MLQLGSADFHLQMPSLPAAELELLSTSLFDSWEKVVERSLTLPDYSLFLQVDEGSIKGVGKVAAALSVIYIGIGNYGSFVSGLKTITEQAKVSRDYLAKQAQQVFACSDSAMTSRSSGGALSAVQKLFVKVQRGDLTSDEAMLQAEAILGAEAHESPGFLTGLKQALKDCPRFPEQIPLTLKDGTDMLLAPTIGNKLPKKPPRPKPELPPPIHYRVEVWRESKSKRKQTRVTQI